MGVDSSKKFSVKPSAMAAAAAVGGLSTSVLLMALTLGMAADMKASAVKRVEAAIASEALVDDAESEPVEDEKPDEGHSPKTNDGAAVSVSDGKDAPSDDKPTDKSEDGAAEATDEKAEEVVAVTQDDDRIIYHVVRGDTLCKISTEYGVSVDAIANANDIRDVNLIYADSSLVIPSN